MLPQEFLDLTTPGFKTIYYNRFAKVAKFYDKIVNMNESSMRQEKVSGMSDLGAWSETDPSSVYDYEDARQLYDQTTTHTKYTKGFRVAEEVWEDDLTGTLKKLPKSMGRGANYIVEVQTANIYAVVTPTYGDGVALLSASHPISGGTESNLLGAYNLNADTMDSMLQLIEETVDYKGLLLGVKAKKLVVPRELKFTALKLIKSLKSPEDSNNAMNPIMDEDLQLIVNPYLSDANAWYVLADDIAIEFYWRKHPTFSSHIDEDTGDAKYLGKMRFSVDVGDWRGVAGATGTS